MNGIQRSLAAIVALLALEACAPNAPSTTAPATVTPATSSTSTPRLVPSPRPAVSNGVVRIELFEWSISPEPFEVPPGTYRAEVVNMGRRAHDLIVAGETEVQTRRLPPGQSQTVTFVIKAGDTVMWCSIDDHRDMGMEAYLHAS